MTNYSRILQQPEIPAFELQDISGGVNSDVTTQCLYRAVYNQMQHPELGIQYGMILVWDKKIKKYDPFFSYHSWNIDEETNTIYDNLDVLQHGVMEFDYDTINPVSQFKAKLIDCSNIKTNLNYKNCWPVIDKISKNYKGYDILYLQNFGYRADGITQITFDAFCDDCDYVEDLLSSDCTKEVSTSNKHTIEVMDVQNMSNDELFTQADMTGADSLVTPDFEFFIKENGKWVKQDMGEEFEQLKLQLQ
jgi:hypothetical protein